MTDPPPRPAMLRRLSVRFRRRRAAELARLARSLRDETAELAGRGGPGDAIAPGPPVDVVGHLSEALAHVRRLRAGRPPVDGDALARWLIQVVDRTDEAAAGEEPAARSLVRWLREVLPSAVDAAGLTRFAGTGPVDLARHEIVGVRETTDESTVDCVAETVQPGYLLDDRLFRRQRVIVWVPAGSGTGGATEEAVDDRTS